MARHGIPASAPADSIKARARLVPGDLVTRLRLCHHPPVAVPNLSRGQCHAGVAELSIKSCDLFWVFCPKI
ncbi:hypothetical protein MPLDJ20_20808 [Mesorhizobium plurifarium]|uniref:Uncharacterized protein n=1 Tax=Mesorhizobium plurifarium TaxID=69974 RepID=A0A090GLF8_MESPL|nr:hypothetical protein MPLDJ20_20808 [Mesorhizobium plurifarium]CDX62191.1 hypothetical protein MPL1032_50240 [Mesorhizobium plurifarium]